MAKKAILAVSFGTSCREPLKSCIEAAEDRLFEAFPSYEQRRAFTSEIIVNKLAERDGFFVETPAEALLRLTDEGFTRVVVQSLHVLPGYEYQELKDTVREFEEGGAFSAVSLGEPLLYAHEDYGSSVEALKKQLPPDKSGEAVLLMGHGTSHFSNACYYCLQNALQSAGLKVHIANAEGHPSLEELLPALKGSGLRKIHLMPFMLVAGEHAANDMAGGDRSWRARLEKEGFEVEVHMRGLGENEAFRQIYVRKALKAVKALKPGKKMDRVAVSVRLSEKAGK